MDQTSTGPDHLSPHPSYAPAAPVADESMLIERLAARDEAAFAALIDRYGDSMLRWARLYLPDLAGAEDVVQETWMAVLDRIGGFERRSSLKTWIFRILLNRIRSRQRREHRQIPFSRYFDPEAATVPALDPARFLGDDHPQFPGHWRHPLSSWGGGTPEDVLLSSEIREMIDAAVADLPPTQREVITLRDIDGWTSREVCSTLRITESNQRVLLHRARARVRQALEDHLE